MSDSRNPLFDSAVALAAITASLYCVGSAKYGGYLSALQLDADVLDQNLQQVLYQGFITAFPEVFLGLCLYTIFHYVYSHVVLPEIAEWLQKSWKSKRRYLGLKHILFSKKKDSLGVQRAKKRTVIFALLTFSILAIILALVYFESEGKQGAVAILEKLDAITFNDNELISVQLNGEQLKLVYLTCGARNCAGIDPHTRVVHYFPQNSYSYYLPVAKDVQTKDNEQKIK